MERTSYPKPAVFTLLALYCSAFGLYFVIIGRLFSYYQTSHVNQTRIVLLVIFFAFTRCLLLGIVRRLGDKWCIKISELIGILELVIIIASSSMF